MRSLLLILSVCTLLTVKGQPDAITGIWLTDKAQSQLRFERNKNGKYDAHLVWIEPEGRNKKDVKNPDPALRGRPLKGIVIISDLCFDAQTNEWTGGLAYDPETGNRYDCFCRLSKDKNTLYLKGFLFGMRWIGRTTEWRREKNIRPE